eukprot:365550-Chlamydomonas_euryale.AAC.3
MTSSGDVLPGARRAVAYCCGFARRELPVSAGCCAGSGVGCSGPTRTATLLSPPSAGTHHATCHGLPTLHPNPRDDMGDAYAWAVEPADAAATVA